jgi:hypothetical protein
MEINELEILLKDTKHEPFIGHIESVELKNHVFKDLYKIGNEDMGYFALKIRKKDKKYVLDTIENMAILSDSENFINKIKNIFEKDGLIIMVSDWLKGFQPIDNNRQHLPLFFAKLAYFNKKNIIKGPYTSMYADGNYFETTEDLIKWEIEYHRKYFQDIIEIKEITEILNTLKNGLSCIIMEDMNTGNLFITNDGRYKFIDTEWIIKGLNLYQFEKIDYFGFEERKWYNINEEAKECYSAYMETLGIKKEEANEQIRAFELLQVLRKITYLKYFGKDNDKEIERRIKMVKETREFI